MPTFLHDFFISSLKKEIQRHLDALQTSTTTQILDALSTNIALPSPDVNGPNDHNDHRVSSTRSPDAVYFDETSTRFPTVILEVSYSQKWEDIHYLADQYITASEGATNVVIGINIGYNGKSSKEATISVWRPKTYTDEDGNPIGESEVSVKNVAFRGEDGIVLGGALELNLSDFLATTSTEAEACSDQLDGAADNNPSVDMPFAVPFSTLCVHLNKAEEIHERRTLASANPAPLPGRRRWKRKRHTLLYSTRRQKHLSCKRKRMQQ